MNTAQPPMYEWKDLPWRKIERDVFKLQKRIYQASRRDDVKAVHRLQRLLLKSWSAKCLAVRRVTQDNHGKRTAGVDGVKSLSPTQRLVLVGKLGDQQKPKPVRRVWIPKPGTSEERPLGIPTMKDRAEQTLVKLVLEPEWEAKFEPNSYGFRPGRSCHDAITAIHININKQPKYVLDTDISKCFDKIAHPPLLKKLETFPSLGRQIKAWLTAGMMDGTELFANTTGVQQGGPLSPLLANVALHGLETAIREAFPRTYIHTGKRKRGYPTIVRYADDLVALHADLEVITKTQQLISNWLQDMGLELKPSKTRITHTLHPHEGNLGFDFLGFHVRQYRVGKTHSGKNPQGEMLGFKTIITPSEEAIRRHDQSIRTTIRKLQNAPQSALIKRLNPMIRGWTNYYSPVAAKQTFTNLSHRMYLKLRRWTKRRHPNWSGKRVARKYWRLEKGHWDFATKEGLSLYRHTQTPIRRYPKVQGTRSPYDGDWVYWGKRLGRHPQLPKRVAQLLQRQKGKCVWCGLYFHEKDQPEIDHIIPQANGGTNRADNWQLLHRHCHDCKTAVDINLSIERCS